MGLELALWACSPGKRSWTRRRSAVVLVHRLVAHGAAHQRARAPRALAASVVGDAPRHRVDKAVRRRRDEVLVRLEQRAVQLSWTRSPPLSLRTSTRRRRRSGFQNDESDARPKPSMLSSSLYLSCASRALPTCGSARPSSRQNAGPPGERIDRRVASPVWTRGRASCAARSRSATVPQPAIGLAVGRRRVGRRVARPSVEERRLAQTHGTTVPFAARSPRSPRSPRTKGCRSARACGLASRRPPSPATYGRPGLPT